MLNAPNQFSTERLRLRRPRLSDAEAIFEYASDRETIRYMDYGPRKTVAEMRDALADKPKQWDAGNFSWVVTIKPEDRPIGTAACFQNEQGVSFGYLFNKNYWGQGYGTEVAQAIAEWAIEQPGVYRLWATCDTENLASARVLEKCGLVREGRLRRCIVRPNISPMPRDVFMYARVRDDD